MTGSGQINAGAPLGAQKSGLSDDLKAQVGAFGDTADFGEEGAQGEEQAPDTTPVMVRTVLNISRDSIAFWNNLTFFFNRWWFPEPDRVTLPFCFFHVVKYSETQKAETSKKRVIMYEPPEETGTGLSPSEARDPFRHGLMQTIVDNVVVQPKEYKLEIVVPFLPFGRVVREATETSKYFNSLLEHLEKGANITTEAKEFISSQLNSVLNADTGSDAQAGLVLKMQEEYLKPSNTLFSGNDMVNKNSLDAMFERGNIIQFKTWMGSDEKYVVITDMTIEKRGNEDDVWRASLTLHELPILSLTPIKSTLVGQVDRAWLKGAIKKYGDAVSYGAAVSRLRYYDVLKEDNAQKETTNGTGA